jgi:hypothetical protein
MSEPGREAAAKIGERSNPRASWAAQRPRKKGEWR